MRYFVKAKRIEIVDERYYQVGEDKDGHPVYYPSVTRILNEAYVKGQVFEQWLKDVGQNASIVSQRAAEAGSVVHNAIERLLRGEELSFDSFVEGDFKYRENRFYIEEWLAILKFLDFYDEYKPETVGVEEIVFNKKEKYAGTLDYRCNIEGEKWLIDFKYGNEIYPSYWLQVAAYAKCFEPGTIDRLGILHLKARTRGRDRQKKIMQGEGWRLTPAPMSIDNLYEAFLHVKRQYDFKLKIGELTEKPKIKSITNKIKLQ